MKTFESERSRVLFIMEAFVTASVWNNLPYVRTLPLFPAISLYLYVDVAPNNNSCPTIVATKHKWVSSLDAVVYPFSIIINKTLKTNAD